MSELDTSLVDMAMGPAMQGQAVDHGLAVHFYPESIPDDVESRAQGRACFKQLDFIRIQVPGDTNKIERPVRVGYNEGDDNIKFAREYELYKANKEQTIVGTPLTEFPPLNKSQIQELGYFHVTTLEQLANLSDTIIQKWMGAGQLRTLAQRYIEQAKNGAPLLQMQAEITTRENEVATLRNQVQELINEVGRLNGTGVVPGVTPAPAPAVPAAPPQLTAVQDAQKQEPFVLPEQPPVDAIAPDAAMQFTDGVGAPDPIGGESDDDTPSEDKPPSTRRPVAT